MCVYLSPSPPFPLSLSQVQGSLSTKMQGVVRLMLRLRQSDPNAKVLIFSSWVDVLDVIADAFAQNGITYRALHHRTKFHVSLCFVCVVRLGFLFWGVRVLFCFVLFFVCLVSLFSLLVCEILFICSFFSLFLC